ncbi:hypothetical protein NKR19_g130 [Coniochaeta hoffmannii]|uniref:Mitochondrial genome maintenance protein MGM101 n=1 Tax=Coniochaeta hoffmannii TaxID=91930 RepID=A0AA38SF61_9PEZI|nr:hypothetical protein NKR19_g130 [Coniochaeta hoffmannii]
MRPNTFPALRQLRRAPSTLCKSAQPLSSRRSSTSTAASKPNNGSYRKVAPKSVNPITKPAVYSNRSTRPTTNFVGMSVEDVDTTLDPLPTIPTPAPSSSSSGPSPTTPAGDSFVQAVQTTSPSYSNGNGSASGGGDGSIDWSSSFHGLSTTAFEPSVAAILMAPVATDDVEIKPDGIAYLPEIKYRRILNTAFGPGGWGLAPRGELVVGEKVVTREYALVVHGRFVAQARGECQYFSEDTIPTAAEGCKSNALSRCCKDLGIASELWDPRYLRNFKKQHCREVWVEHVVNKKKRQIWTRKDTEPQYPYVLARR